MFFNSNEKIKHGERTRSNAASSNSMPRQSVHGDLWLHSSQLKLGMYVHELDKPWEQTRFLFQGFFIDSYDLLRQVQDSCEHANVQMR